MRVECAGKQTFLTRDAAERIAKAGRRRHDCALHAYFCLVCSAYHVGNKRLDRSRKARITA